MPAPSVTPMTNVAAAINGNDDVDADDDQRHGADAPHRHHHRQVAPRQPPRRHRQRADRAADPEERQDEAVRLRAVVEAVLGDERQQHLDRAQHHQHEHAREQQRPQQPRRAAA